MKKTKTRVGALHGPGHGQRAKGTGEATRRVWIIEARVKGGRRWKQLDRNYRSRSLAREAARGYLRCINQTPGAKLMVTQYAPKEIP